MVNWWLAGGIPPANCIAAYQSIGVASKAASLVNLANPGVHDLVEVNTVLWTTAGGWQGNNSGYFTTDIIPAQGDSAICRFVAVGGALVSAAFGEFKTTATITRYYIHIWELLGAGIFGRRYAYGTAPSIVDDLALLGTLAIVPGSGYKNGIFQLAIPVGDVGTLPIWIMCRNQNSAPSNRLKTGDYLPALAFYNIDITAYLPYLHYAMMQLPDAINIRQVDNTFIVPTEDRTWSVTTENRKFVVPEEVRTFDVE